MHTGAIVTLSGVLVCRDEQETDVVERHLPLHIALTRAEGGCLSFEVRRAAEPLCWQVEESFRDAASFHAHQARVQQSEWGRVTAGFERRYVVHGL